MGHYSEDVKSDARRWKDSSHRQSVTEISQKLGIHVITLYKWCKVWWSQGKVVPPSQKISEGWGPGDNFTVLLEPARLTATELDGYCHEPNLLPEQVDRRVRATQAANTQTLLTRADQMDLLWRHQEDEQEGQQEV